MYVSCCLFLPQVQYDPEVAGPRHLVEAVEGVGFEAAAITGQRLGEAGSTAYFPCSPLACLPVLLPRPSRLFLRPAILTAPGKCAMHLRSADFVDNNRRETEEWRRQFRNAALLTVPVFISEPAAAQPPCLRLLACSHACSSPLLKLWHFQESQTGGLQATGGTAGVFSRATAVAMACMS